jgi:hypothetical protein
MLILKKAYFPKDLNMNQKLKDLVSIRAISKLLKT